MTVLLFVGIPILVWVMLVIVTLPRLVDAKPDTPSATPQSDEPAPRFTRDYTGRLWIEKRRKGFFRPLRRRRPRPEDVEE